MSSWNTLELASAARRQQHQREHRDRRRQRPRHRPSTLPAALRAGAWPAGVEVVVGAAKIERFGSPGRSAPEDRRRDIENVAAPAVRAVRAEGHLPKRGPPLENGPPSPSPPDPRRRTAVREHGGRVGNHQYARRDSARSRAAGRSRSVVRTSRGRGPYTSRPEQFVRDETEEGERQVRRTPQ